MSDWVDGWISEQMGGWMGRMVDGGRLGVYSVFK